MTSERPIPFPLSEFTRWASPQQDTEMRRGSVAPYVSFRYSWKVGQREGRDGRASSRHHECAVCMETFKSPRILSCFHTFCLACLKQLVQHSPGTFSCPTCRTAIEVPVGGVDKFQVNFYVEADIASQQAGSRSAAKKCDVCKKGQATHKCSDCNQFSCDNCTTIHASFAATKSHTVLTLSSAADAAVKVAKERYCSTHTDEKLRFFCTKCSAVICRDCKLTSHEGHATTDLSAKSSAAKKLIKKVTKQSHQNLVPKLRQALKAAEQHRATVQRNKEAIKRTLTQRAQELKQEVDNSLDEVLQQLDQKTGEVDKMAASMTHDLARFLSLTEYAERVTQGGFDADILNMSTQMKNFFGTRRSKRQVQDLILGMSNTKQSSESTNCSALQSFTTDEWRAEFNLDEVSTTIQCPSCMRYCPKSTVNCPRCGAYVAAPHTFQAYGFASAVNIQCPKCLRYNQNTGRCPSCGHVQKAETREEAFSTIKEAIPMYIGKVSKVTTQLGSQKNPQTLENYGLKEHFLYPPIVYGTLSPTTHIKRTEPAGAVAREIIAEIMSIQSVLSQ